MRFEKHYFSEVDKYCIELYSKRFPEAISLGDITNIEFEDLPEGDWIITGGFPCQDISIAGKGKGIKGERSGLWFTMFNIIRILRPRFAIIENVGAITIRGLDTVLGCLAEIGYDAEWQDIRASDMGAPHKRERIWIIAYPNRGQCDRQEKEVRTRGDSINIGSQDVAYSRLQRQTEHEEQTAGIEQCGEDVPDTISKYDDNARHGTGEICRERSEKAEVQRDISDTMRSGRESGEKPQGRSNIKVKGLETIPSITEHRSRPGEWLPEPCMGVLVDGLPVGMDRFEGRLSNKSYKAASQIKGIGNAIISQIAELLFRQIKKLIDD